MNGRSAMAAEAAHRATRECLPWLLNGRLGGAELDAAHAHLAGCEACRADLAELQRLREAAAAPDPDCNADAALARLFERIDAPARLPSGTSGAPPAATAPARAAAAAPPSPPPSPPPRGAANDPRWLRRAALLQCGVIVMLAALLAWPGPPIDGFRGLGAAPATQGRAVVVFRPATAERELRRIVRTSGARIVDGPTVTDAYVLALPDGDVAASLARLRAEPAVLLAEPLGSESRP